LTKASFRNAMRRRRCLLPADGSYEWTGPKRARRPFLLRPRQGGLFAFAGIWEGWRGETDTVAILTCPANGPSRLCMTHACLSWPGAYGLSGAAHAWSP
jgi:putative SOS response-associated peptidase YedK